MITFYFIISALLDKINTQVLFAARKRDDKSGIDGNSTKDADLIILQHLSFISAKLFSDHTSPMGRETINLDTPLEPYEFDATFTDPDTSEETEHCIIFRIIPPPKFDETIKFALNEALEHCMIDYTVWQWMMDSDIKGWELYKEKYERSISNLISIVTRRINLRRTYNLY